MHLTRLEVRNLRNLTSVSLFPINGLNIIEGRNASGKTSLLESIHLLALARSFRTLKTTQIIQYGFDSLILFAEISSGNLTHKIGLQRFPDNKIELRLNGETIHKRAELANLLPLQLITPDSISLLSGSPKERRQFLDWTMFHVEHSFQALWSTYQRALKQRNALLRLNCVEALSSWDKAVAEYGEKISRLRFETLNQLLPHVQHYCQILLPGHVLAMEYKQGWKSGTTLFAMLSESIENDLKRKFTSVGPHRADIVIKSSGQRVVEHLSRGQLKLLLCALRLGQMAYLKQRTGKTSLVLIDDLPAELDATHRQLLLQLLYDLEGQVFITATDRLELNSDMWKDVKVFHVEHGEIQEVI